VTLLLTLAWRNIWRNKRRTILTILAILFAAFLTSAMRGVAVGTWEYNVRNTLEMFAGYLQVQREGYQENPSVSKSFVRSRLLDSVITREQSVAGFAPRVMAEGLVSFRANAAGAALFGVDPDAERRVSRFHQRLREGVFFRRGDPSAIVVGYKLLENLKAHVGDTLVILAQGRDGVLADRLFRVSGSVRLGSPEFDAMAVFMDLGAAQELLAMEGRLHSVVISLSDLRGVTRVREALRRDLDAAGGTGLAVLTWQEVLPDLKQAMDFDRIGDWFFYGILIVIVALGILNTLLMSVTERFREFGVSLSLGMQPGLLVRLVLVETLMIALIGSVIGAGVGYAANVYVYYHPISLTGDLRVMYEQYGFLPQIVSTLNPGVALTVMSLILGISVVSAIYPAYRVYHLEPLKGIRYT